jgi:hypothetical protein
VSHKKPQFFENVGEISRTFAIEGSQLCFIVEYTLLAAVKEVIEEIGMHIQGLPTGLESWRHKQRCR